MHISFKNELICPITGEELNLKVIEEDRTNGQNILCRTGILWSEGNYWYPIINFVPIMLCFPTQLLSSFSEKHKEQISATCPTAKQPDHAPKTGERSVQITFTEEWSGLADDQLSFMYDEDELLLLHRDVWLQMKDDERHVKTSVLDVGCGFGKEAIILSKLFPNALVAAVDLNFSLVAAGERLVKTTRVNPVVASLFHIPLKNGRFEHVHCQGVMHHTYSTKNAFDAIQKKVALDGTYFVWVYAKEDRHVVTGVRGILVWLYWTMSHSIFRPVLSRSPAVFRSLIVHVISGLLHPVLARRDRGGAERWKYRNTVHGIRDAFTPRYAWEHGFNEVLVWFHESGFLPQIQSAGKYKELFNARLVGVGVLGRRHEKR